MTVQLLIFCFVGVLQSCSPGPCGRSGRSLIWGVVNGLGLACLGQEPGILVSTSITKIKFRYSFDIALDSSANGTEWALFPCVLTHVDYPWNAEKKREERRRLRRRRSWTLGLLGASVGLCMIGGAAYGAYRYWYVLPRVSVDSECSTGTPGPSDVELPKGAPLEGGSGSVAETE